MLARLDARAIALLILFIAAATLAGAWAFQAAGYAPCELCLKQRYAYYLGLPLALAAWFAAGVNRRGARFLFALLALAFVANAVLAAYHSGVEFKWWPGPADCTGAYQGASNVADFMKQLQQTRVVRCDEVALRILGFSMANANIFVSAALAALASLGAGRVMKRG
ncbi:MAG TPA: disulfide bond formation protein B [Beijerinckiaceae bacterium]|nr:disulfide bond formation protein B [Methylobacteriaceae bacterium]MCO5089283.1 disulfide bond formation protein B [Methylobacteriaceae bacterium]HPG04164.1 disulfide bond formation protein B [Rhodoblastus sp.]HRY05020.1 disulfide bond formation protein B [Beijerinckiaceae bacterium]